VAAAGSGTVGTVNTLNTDGSDVVYFGATGVPTRTTDLIVAHAATAGGSRRWNTTCSYILQSIANQPSLNGYIACPTGEGWGPGWTLNVTVSIGGAAPVAVPSSVIAAFAYAPPVVTSILVEQVDGRPGACVWGGRGQHCRLSQDPVSLPLPALPAPLPLSSLFAQTPPSQLSAARRSSSQATASAAPRRLSPSHTALAIPRRHRATSATALHARPLHTSPSACSRLKASAASCACS